MAVENQHFGVALEWLKGNRKVSRAGWNGKRLFIYLQVPDAGSKMTLPYIAMCIPPKDGGLMSDLVPWLASQTDLLSEDWFLVPESTIS